MSSGSLFDIAPAEPAAKAAPAAQEEAPAEEPAEDESADTEPEAEENAGSGVRARHRRVAVRHQGAPRGEGEGRA